MEIAELTISCTGCGASLKYSAQTQVLKCEYCGCETEIPRQEDELPQSAELIVPMTVEPQALKDAVYQHLASGDYTPDDLVDSAVLTKVERFYVPAYVYGGHYSATWTASFGYDRRETYTDVASDGKGGTRTVTKTRVVTDWRPVNGTATGDFAVYAYAGKRDIPAKLIEQSRGRAEPTTFDTAYTQGFEVEQFVASANDIRQGRGNAQIEELIAAGVTQHAQGDHQRDWHWDSTTQVESRCALVPICHVVYEYQDKAYHLWTDGTATDHMQADQPPVDSGRQKSVSLGYVPLVLGCIALVINIFIAQDGQGHYLWGGLMLLLALLYGSLRRKAILSYSRKLRDSVLAQRRAGTANTVSMSSEEQQGLVDAFQRPTRPVMARTEHDPLVLSLASLVVFISILAPGLANRITENHTAEQTAGRAAVESALAASVPVAAAVNTSSASAPVEADAPAAVDLSALSQPLSMAAAGQWDELAAAMQAMKDNAQTPQVGNRAAARRFNQAGLAALRQEDFPRAQQAFDQGLEQNPADIELRNNLAQSLEKQGKLAEAATTLTQVLTLQPDRSVAWLNLASVLASSKDQASAISALKAGLFFSAHREKLERSLTQQGNVARNEALRAAIIDVLPSMGDIPSFTAKAAPVEQTDTPAPQQERPAVHKTKKGRSKPSAEEAYVKRMNKQLEQQLQQIN